ncbi:hypothetical protein HKX42_06990 [Salinisphaera sp. USBA-960]|uniref:iron-sulfur cluster assembly scaffold protein n=1 Tax=Salinisphaera orenii TaxID=856731 RepID=UPI000DBE174A|nr:hypothetical protein [Salifodinibacter halophilus]NNC26617.1 hypothetical protein [Salifodinibacter halophilus]
MSNCCSPSHERKQLSVHSCFERGRTTRGLPPLAIAGERVTTSYGLWAAFSLRLEADSLCEIRFTASTCTTLIAYCQALVELIQGRRRDEARESGSRFLIDRLPGVPMAKHDRATLAAAAFQAALAATNKPPETGETK